MKLHVEGGGDSEKQYTVVRKTFQKFFENANVAKKPGVVVCGGRQRAWGRYESARARNEEAALLMDSEQAYTNQPLRAFLSAQGFALTTAHRDEDLHLMVRCMEDWLLADRPTLSSYYGQGFQETALPNANSVLGRSPAELESDLKRATRNTTKGEYSKGQHSWQLLEKINPTLVGESSPTAQRFLDWLRA